jgi:hypothetical protein
VTVDTKLVSLRELPYVSYLLDSNMIPKGVFMPDGHFDQMNRLLTRLGRKPIASQERLLDSLLAEVIVYYGDSIVHHPAAGIDFYHK